MEHFLPSINEMLETFILKCFLLKSCERSTAAINKGL